MDVDLALRATPLDTVTEIGLLMTPLLFGNTYRAAWFD
jgi:hypothetical protein